MSFKSPVLVIRDLLNTLLHHISTVSNIGVARFTKVGWTVDGVEWGMDVGDGRGKFQARQQTATLETM